MTDWTSADATRVLALALHRYAQKAYYARNGEPADTAKWVYSNGTEAEMAVEDAEALLKLGPMLKRVLEAGVRALAQDTRFNAYIVALYSGDEKSIVAVEDALRGEVTE